MRPSLLERSVGSRWLTPLAGLLVLVAYAGIRLLDLDRMVTIDETLWIARSANFLNAILQGDWDLTYQMAHPGVITMWAGAAGFGVVVPEFVFLHPNQVRTALVHGPLREIGADPLETLVALRIAKLIVQTAIFMLGVLFLRRLFGGRVAVLAGILIAFEPFIIGHDRLLHIDGLFAASAFTATLAIAIAASTTSAPPAGLLPWTVAGGLTAIAWLSRTPGLVLVPLAGLAVVASAWIAARRPVRKLALLWATAVRFTVFIAALCVCSVALWPALWAAPAATFEAIADFSGNAASVGHETTQVFNGEVVKGDPGPWYYPVTLAWRLSPVTIAGVILFLVLLAFARRTVVRDRAGLPLLVVGGFGGGYFLLMTLAAKKFDRYVLPDYQVLVLFSTLGWLGLATLAWRHRDQAGRIAAALLIGAVVIGQGAIALSTRPYGLDYFSPLLGGMPAAEGELLLGWGEGLDEAAAIILAQPRGEHAVVGTSNNRTSLLYFLPETARVLQARSPGNDATVQAWMEMDYFVAYTMQWQRNGGFEIRYLEAFEPIGTVEVNGVEFARVYDVRDIPPPPEVLTSGCVWNFGDRVSLLTWESERLTNPFTGSPTLRRIMLYLAPGQAGAGGQPLAVTVTLVPDNILRRRIVKEAEVRLPDEPGLVVKETVNITLPEGQSLNEYDIEVEIADPGSGASLQARQYGSGDTGEEAELGRCAP